VHTGPASAQAADALGAEAFTMGPDIHFAANAYDPDSAGGRRLIAHEVAHTVQQRGLPRVALERAAVSQPDQSHERLADEFAGLLRADTEHSDRDTELPAATRARMERSFGQDLGQVRVHPDSAEVPAGTKAITRGRDIYFAPGAFAPDSERGDEILAHELAHVVQSDAAGAPASSVQALEADARQAARSVSAGQHATVHLSAPAGQALGFSDERQPPRNTEAAGNGPRPAPQPSPAVPGTAQAPGAAAQPGPQPAAGRAAESGAQSAAGPAASSTGASAPLASGTGAAPAPIAAQGSDNLLIPEAPAELSAGAHARLAEVEASVDSAVTATADLPAAEISTEGARAAVEEPGEEQDAMAQAGVVATVDDRPPPSPEIEAACERIREVIQSKRPPDEASLVEARPREMAAEAGGEMNAGIEERAGTVQAGYDDMNSAPEGQPSREAVPAELPPEVAEVPEIDAGAAAPDELAPEDVSLDADIAAQTARIEGAGMTTEPAQLVEDGPIAEARAGLGELETMAQSDPAAVLADQAAAIATAADDMRALQEAAEQALADARSGTVGSLGIMSGEITGTEEEKRAAAGQAMQDIYQRARDSVDALLAPLSEAALARWNTGVESLATAFETSLAGVKRRIEERYEVDNSDFWGAINPFDDIAAGLTRAGDAVFGLPDWVVEEYDRAEETFATGCTDLITDISRDVNAVIEDCQGIIEQARRDIDDLVASLPEELRAWAEGEAARIGTELDALESQVTDTQASLNQDLVDRASSAVQEVRERVHELREAARGLLGRIADAVAEFLADPGRAIVDGLLRVLGIPPANFWALVDQLGNVIDGIAADPMGFANNLMAGVGQGFGQFFDNFPQHMLQGLVDWLFSKLGEAGVTLPADFSLQSIVTVALQVLGITWDRIRMLLARHIGEQNVAILDKAIELVSVLIEQGPGGIVEMIKDQLDPQVIMDAVLDAAMQYLMEALITRVTARILMLFNPAGAILQAIEAIYRVLSWVMNNAARIFTLVETVVNGAADVLAGNVGGLASAVEMGLAGLIGPVIGFLADYIGLGGIPEAIRDVILRLQQWVEGILDRVIGFLAERARALLQALGIGGENQEPGEDETGESDEQTAGMPSMSVPFAMAGEDHTIYLRDQDGQLQVTMASGRELPLTTKFRSLYTELDDWRYYLEQIRPKVSTDVQSEIDGKLAQLQTLRLTAVSDYNEIYTRTWGDRRGNVGHENPDREKRAMELLKQRAENDKNALVAWATSTGVQDLSSQALNTSLRALGTKSFNECVAERQELVRAILLPFKTQNGAPVQYRGSLAEGKRGPHKANVRFNPDDFDLDLYVVDRAAHEQALRDRPQLREFENSPIPARRAGGSIQALEVQVVNALEAPGAVPGLRRGANYILLRKTPT
jgi:hypothetical protein